MEYINLTTNQIKSQGEIRKEHSNMSFPRVWNAGVFDLLGIAPILASPKPVYNRATQLVSRDGAVQDVSGNWVQAWKIVELDKEAVESTLANAKKAKKAEIDRTTEQAILAVASRDRQRNYMAKAQQIERRQRLGTSTAEEDATIDVLEGMWVKIESLVIDGDARELAVDACNTVAEVDAI